MSLPEISPEEAKRLIDQGAVLIDIRSVQEHAKERIPGAQNRPLGPSMSLDASGPIVFHCRSGQRTLANATRLAELANCEAYILEGGVDAWKRAGLPVAGDATQPAAGIGDWRAIAKALGVRPSSPHTVPGKS